MLKKRLGVICLIICMIASLTVPAYADTKSDLADAKAAQDAAEANLDSTNSTINSLQSQKNDLQSYLNDLKTQVRQLSDSLTDLNDKITDKNTEIENTKAAVVRAQYDEETQYADMETRIQYMYENGNSDMFTTLVESHSISDFINRADEIKKINEYDRQCLAEYKEAVATVKKKEADLEDEQASLQSLKTAAENKKQEVVSLADSTDQKISEYTANISDAELQASNLQSQIQQQKNLVADLTAKAEAEEQARKAAEEAAAKAAALAEKKKEEEAAAAKAAEAAEAAKDDADTSDSGSDDSSSTSDSSDTKPAADTSADTPSVTPSTTNKKYLGNFMLTAYCPCAKCCGRANQPTASGVMPTPNHTVAMAGVPFGTKLLINGTVYTVEDLGTPYGHVDIFMLSHQTCLEFGVQYAEVYEVS